MMESAPKQKEITLRSGLKLTLCEVSFMDLQDGEEILKIPHDQWISVVQTEDPESPNVTIKDALKTIPVIVWLMARKAGLTIDDVLARKWVLPLETLRAQFTMKDLSAHAATIVSCFFDPQ